MKKKIIVGIILILLVIVVFVFINKNTQIKKISLKEEIELKKGETVQLKGENVFITIKDFTYSPAPAGTMSDWSGLAVIYQIEINGVKYETDYMGNFQTGDYEKIPYYVLIINSDYKTFAKIKVINKSEV